MQPNKNNYRGYVPPTAPVLTAEQAFKEIREMNGLPIELKTKAANALMRGITPSSVIAHCRSIDFGSIALDQLDED